MQKIKDEIIDWLHTKQNWLQETAKRILDNGEVTDTDIKELVELLKTKEGQSVTNVRTFSSLGTVGSSNTLLLESLSDVKVLIIFLLVIL